MKGIESFPAKSPIPRHLRELSGCTSIQADAGVASAFGDHLADIARQDGKAQDAGVPDRAVPGLSCLGIQPSAETARAVKLDTGDQRAEVPAMSLQIALTQNGNTSVVPHSGSSRVSGPASRDLTCLSPIETVAHPLRPSLEGSSASAVASGGQEKVLAAKRASAGGVPARGPGQLPETSVSASREWTISCGWPAKIDASLTGFSAAGVAADVFTPAALPVLRPGLGGSDFRSSIIGTLAPIEGRALEDSATAVGGARGTVNLVADGNSSRGQGVTISSQVKVLVISRETHLVPSLRSSMAPEIAQGSTGGDRLAMAADTGASAPLAEKTALPDAGSGLRGLLGTQGATGSDPRGGRELASMTPELREHMVPIEQDGPLSAATSGTEDTDHPLSPAREEVSPRTGGAGDWAEQRMFISQGVAVAAPKGGPELSSAVLAPARVQPANRPNWPVGVEPSGMLAPSDSATSAAQAAFQGTGDVDGAAAQGVFITQRAVVAGSKRGLELISAVLAPARDLTADRSAGLAAGGGLTSGQQIGEFIAAGVGVSNRSASITEPSVRGTPGPSGLQPLLSRVHTLQLQLDPESLGKVTVSMRLSGTGLELSIAAERPETVQLIEEDKDTLTSKLRSLGYSLESFAVQGVDARAPQQEAKIDGPPNSQSQSSGQANGDPSAHDRPPPQDNRQRFSPPLADEHQDGVGISNSGDFYI